MDLQALFKIEYGLYVLTANDGKDNGCIINTVMQVTSNPCQIAIAVNKANYTCELIQRTRKFNLSILDKNTKFDLIKNFGYQSGRNVDKFENFFDTKRSPNNVLYITQNTNAFLSAYVKQEVDLGTHILFVAQLIEAQSLTDEQTLTYDFYQKNNKPQPQTSEKKGWRCKICGFVYEHEILPPDYVCPICKHGAIDFEKI